MKHMNVTIKSVVCGIHLQEDKNACDEVIHWFFKYIPMTEKILLYSLGLLVVVPGILSISIILLDPHSRSAHDSAKSIFDLCICHC